MARDIALLTNPTSGKGLGARTAAIALPRLREAGFVVRELQGSDAGEARSWRAVPWPTGSRASSWSGVTAWSTWRRRCWRTPAPRSASSRSGTGNDAARFLDIPRRDPQAAADVVVAGRTRTIDLAKAGPTYVVNVVSAGFDAVVNERANAMRWPRGQMRYNLATLAELRTFAPLDYVLDLDGTTKRVRAMLVAVGNGPSFGGGLRITEGALLDDGLLDVVLFHPVSKPELLRTFPRLFRGTHTSHRAYEHHRVRQVTIAASGIVAYGDGERMGSLPLTVTAVPAALRVIVGPSPAVTP